MQNYLTLEIPLSIQKKIEKKFFVYFLPKYYHSNVLMEIKMLNEWSKLLKLMVNALRMHASIYSILSNVKIVPNWKHTVNKIIQFICELQSV